MVSDLYLNGFSGEFALIIEAIILKNLKRLLQVYWLLVQGVLLSTGWFWFSYFFYLIFTNQIILNLY